MDGIKVEGPQALFQIGPITITQTILSMVIVSLILGVAGVLLGRNLQKRPGKLQVLTEKGVSMLMNLVTDTMGKHNIGWVPFIGTLFLSSILGSLIGLTGFLRSTTADLAVVLTWSLMVSAVIWYQSIKRNGFLGWLKGFTEPIWVMTPMNIVSEIAQPIAMAFRHFGNVAGGGIITSIIYTALSLLSTVLMGIISDTWIVPCVMLLLCVIAFIVGRKMKNTIVMVASALFTLPAILGILMYLDLLGGIQIPIFQFGIPAVLSIYFDLFSGFVQAFVFSLLSMVYISGACPPPEEAAA